MTIDEMLELVCNGEDSPTYELMDLLEKNNFSQAIEVIKEYLNCDENNAKIVCTKFKEKMDELYKPDSNLSPQEIARNNAIAREWQNKPKCPTCSSTNVKKISGTAKLAGAVAFGLLSKTARSQFKCNNCGYKW